MTMRSNRVNYVAVGAFVAASLTGLVVFLSILTGRTGAVETYHTFYSNVAGLKAGSKVIYEGYRIGQIESVAPVGGEGKLKFRVNFEVFEGWQIPKDSVAKIAAPSLLESPGLSITAGISPDFLSPDQPLPSHEGPDLFSIVSNAAEKLGALTEESLGPLLSNVDRGVDNINRLLESEGGVLAQNLVLLVEDAQSMVTDLRTRIPKITDQVEAITGDVKGASSELRRLATPENRKKIEETLVALRETTTEVNTALASAQRLLTNVDGVVEETSGDAKKSLSETRYIVESVARHIDAINENVEGMSLNLLEFSRQIRQSPGLLLSSQPIDDEGVLKSRTK